MTLRTKTISATILTLLGLILLMALSTQVLIQRRFEQIELQDGRVDMSRVLDAIKADIESLDGSVTDYAQWDNTYDFIAGKRPSYMQRDITENTTRNLRLSVVGLYRKDGSPVAEKFFQSGTGRPVPVPKYFRDYLKANPRIIRHASSRSRVSGIVLLPEAPLLVASQPVLRRDGSTNGSLLMGRFLDRNAIEQLSKDVRFELELQPYRTGGLPRDFLDARFRLLRQRGIVSIPLSEDEIASYAFLRDIGHKPVMILRMVEDRPYYLQGQLITGYIRIFVVVIAVVFGVILVASMEILVLRRLLKLNRAMETIGQAGDLSARVPALQIGKSDEMANLALSVNKMLQALEKAQCEASARILASEQQFRAVFDTAPEGIAIFETHSLRLCAVNGALAASVGYDPEILLECTFDQLLEPFDIAQKKLLIETAARMEPFALELMLLTKKSQVLIVEVTGTPFEYNHEPAVLVFLRDVTVRTSMERRISRLNQCFVNLGIDPVDNINQLTALCGELLGASHAWYNRVDGEYLKIVGRWQMPECDRSVCTNEKHVCYRVLHSINNRTVVLPDLKDARYRERQHGSCLAATNAQSYLGRPVVFDGKRIGVLSVAFSKPYHPDDNDLKLLDIISVAISVEESRYMANLSLLHEKELTEEAYEQLASTNRQLEEAVNTANRMAAEAKAASKAKSDFLANVSHEIRTPLNGVIGMSELLINTPLTDHQKLYTRTITYSAELLLTLINDILDFSKIEAGKMELETAPFHLHDMIEGLVETFSQRASVKGIELICGIDPAVPVNVAGDQVRLRQVLSNLLANAVKFTEKGMVCLKCSVKEQDDRSLTLYFEVKDTGIGFTDEQRQRLFRSFSQVDASTTRKYGGTGLGLAICKRLVELMGGKIDSRSVPGEGSTFWFTAHLQTAAAGEKAVTHYDRLRGLRVLVVDDNTINQEILTDVLTNWGMSVEIAGDGEEALDCLERAAHTRNPFALALIDFQMPGLDGIELAGEIKARPAIADTMLILLTSIIRLRSDEEIAAAGFKTYLMKPIRQSALFDAIIGTVTGTQAVSKPRRKKESHKAIKPAEVPVFRQDLRLLLAEDNEINRMVFHEMLSTFGLQCDVVENGADALRAVKEGRYDILFIDCQMPVMDGYTATRELRQFEAEHGITRPTIVIALTANAMTSDREQCLAAGMNDYMSKPLQSDVLLATLQRWMGGGAMPAQREAAPAVLSLEMTALEEQLPVNMQDLLKRCAGKESFALHMLAQFVERTGGEIDEIKAAIERQDSAAVKELAHRIKGAAATLAAEQLRQCAAQIEEYGKLADMEHARTCLGEFYTQLGKLHAFLDNYKVESLRS
ncbi:MAG: response regulator [Armatimonadota bacterium]